MSSNKVHPNRIPIAPQVSALGMTVPERKQTEAVIEKAAKLAIRRLASQVLTDFQADRMPDQD